MHTSSRHVTGSTSIRRLSLVCLFAAALAGCSSAAAPTASPASSQVPSTTEPSLVPGQDPNTSVGIDLPAPIGDPGVVDPAGRQLVVPRPGQLDVRPISAELLTAAVDGHHVRITVGYTSGVEPCNVLDSIVVAVDAAAHTFGITLREGRGPEDVMCIEIAQAKRAIVDLGDLAPGSYVVTDTTGGAPPITVVVG